MENTLKIDDFWKSVPFCIYLRNESSDLYEIWDFYSEDSEELSTDFM